MTSRPVGQAGHCFLVVSPGILDHCDISDHYSIFCEIGAPPVVRKANELIVLSCDKSKLDIDLFIFDLSVALQEYFSSLSPI